MNTFKLLLVALALPCFAMAQGITQIYVGTGLTGYSGDGGPATLAELSAAVELVHDHFGNLFFIQDGRVRKVDDQGVISTYAGTGSTVFGGDGGPANQATFGPSDIAVDLAGDLYISDLYNKRIRKVDHVTGIITTIAGNGANTDTGNGGQAINAAIANPTALAVDLNGNIYVASGYKIRKIDATGVITNFCGTGSAGNSGDGGPANSALITAVFDIFCVPSGDVYFTHGNVVRKIDANGIINTVAGNGNAGYNGENTPALQTPMSPGDIAVDANGNIVMNDRLMGRVRLLNGQGLVSTIAGGGINSGGGIPPTDLQLGDNYSATIDTCANVFISNVHFVYKVVYPYCNALSVQTYRSPLTFTLSPNPATTQTTIASNNKIKELWLCNTIGQIAMKQNCDAQKVTLDIEQLPAGVYFVRVVDVNGAGRVEKVVKQ